MQDLKALSHLSKKNILCDLIEKNVRITYDDVDLPNGKIGPQTLIGKIVSVGILKFTFEFDNERILLSIDGVIEFDTIEKVNRGG